MSLPWKLSKVNKYPLPNSQCTLPRVCLGTERRYTSRSSFQGLRRLPVTGSTFLNKCCARPACPQSLELPIPRCVVVPFAPVSYWLKTQQQVFWFVCFWFFYFCFCFSEASPLLVAFLQCSNTYTSK